MTSRFMLTAVVVLVSAMALSACANTIRGVGTDAAGAVNATQAAGNSVGKAAAH